MCPDISQSRRGGTNKQSTRVYQNALVNFKKLPTVYAVPPPSPSLTAPLLQKHAQNRSLHFVHTFTRLLYQCILSKLPACERSWRQTALLFSHKGTEKESTQTDNRKPDRVLVPIRKSGTPPTHKKRVLTYTTTNQPYTGGTVIVVICVVSRLRSLPKRPAGGGAVRQGKAKVSSLR